MSPLFLELNIFSSNRICVQPCHLDRILPVQQGLWQSIDIRWWGQPCCCRTWSSIPDWWVFYKVSGVAQVHWHPTASIFLFQPWVVVKLEWLRFDYRRLFHLQLSPFQNWRPGIWHEGYLRPENFVFFSSRFLHPIFFPQFLPRTFACYILLPLPRLLLHVRSLYVIDWGLWWFYRLPSVRVRLFVGADFSSDFSTRLSSSWGFLRIAGLWVSCYQRLLLLLVKPALVFARTPSRLATQAVWKCQGHLQVKHPGGLQCGGEGGGGGGG